MTLELLCYWKCFSDFVKFSESFLCHNLYVTTFATQPFFYIYGE